MTATPRSILLLAPHPDDEVVGACICLRRAIAEGARVEILFLTTGVPAADWPWKQASNYARRVERRKAEAQGVAARLGFDIAGFLDIPSRGLLGRVEAARAVVLKHPADELWVPAYEGGHQDHDVANALGFSLRRERRVFEFAEYNYEGGRVNANAFIGASASGGVTVLSGQEADFKRRLLSLYESERGNLGYVGFEREALRPLAGADYAKPAHPGKLFRERFHWVPFRHPGIDWTPQAVVNRELSRFTSRFS